MADLKTLEDKVNQLEQRLTKLEAKIASPADSSDHDFMAALYKKAKELVLKHHKASIIFLQKKLMIDYHRAAGLLAKLQSDGVI